MYTWKLRSSQLSKNKKGTPSELCESKKQKTVNTQTYEYIYISKNIFVYIHFFGDIAILKLKVKMQTTKKADKCSNRRRTDSKRTWTKNNLLILCFSIFGLNIYICKYIYIYNFLYTQKISYSGTIFLTNRMWVPSLFGQFLPTPPL